MRDNHFRHSHFIPGRQLSMSEHRGHRWVRSENLVSNLLFECRHQQFDKQQYKVHFSIILGRWERLNLWTQQIIYFTSYLQHIFYTLPEAKYLFHLLLHFFLSTKLDPKLGLVGPNDMEVMERIEARLYSYLSMYWQLFISRKYSCNPPPLPPWRLNDGLLFQLLRPTTFTNTNLLS